MALRQNKHKNYTTFLITPVKLWLLDSRQMYYYVWFQKEAPITHTKGGKAVPNTKKLFTHLKHEQTLTKGNDFLKLDKVVCVHICGILPFAQTEIHCHTLQFVGSNASSN